VCTSWQYTCRPTSVLVLKHCCKSYGLYDVNGFLFHSTIFEACRPLSATSNTTVVTRAVDAEGHESKNYRIIKNIIEYNFARNKNLKTVFFDCDCFDPNCGTQENEFGMVEVKHVHRLHGCDPFVIAHQVEKVYYMSYPCEKLSAWWVVYRVNSREWLHTPLTILVIRKIKWQLERLMWFINKMHCHVHLDPDSTLNSLLGDANDVTVPEQRKQTLRKKRNIRY
jgi:hypothetical protein